MQNYIIIIYFITTLLSDIVDGRIHQDERNYDRFDLYELFQRRSLSSFSEAQRRFQTQVLNSHNKYRAKHCAPPLTLDDKLSHVAQKYAEHLAAKNVLEHSDSFDYGENLFQAVTTYSLDKFDGAEVTRSWYDEVKYYDFKNPKYSKDAGHFTQVIWKETENLGVGFATIKVNSRHILYVVAEYSPPGNINDAFAENVLPATC